MKISIDETKCQGQRRCFNLYPTLFSEGEEGKGIVRQEIVAEDEEINAQSAANACPNGAIIIEY